ncbi:MAG: MATE family efflux transporter [Eubacteriales bacterium]|nr:MATE family efflux transporter [Eubacteriales bacterium]
MGKDRRQKKTGRAEELLFKIKNGKELTSAEQLQLVLRLSLPAVMAQITSIIMQYIDASMVGQLGAAKSAAIGLVSTSTWLFGGLCIAAAAGFSVQAAQLIGAGRDAQARAVLRQAIVATMMFSAALLLVGMAISRPLPGWLGADAEIREDAVRYFTVYVLSLPFVQLCLLSANMLQCSGNMRTPSILNVMMCALDVVLNSLLIFPERQGEIFGIAVRIPGADLGVAGAALGTALAQGITGILMCYFLVARSSILHLSRGESWRPEWECIERAVRIAVPMGLEHALMNGAMIATTRIVAPLGNISIAANSFAVTAESLCYMPGYGIADAATTLIGQSLGAGRRELVRRFSRLTVAIGMAVMAATGAVMFFAAPWMLALLTPDPEIQELGVRVLRIEAFAEPLFAASIVVSGALRGAGDTLIPSLMNFFSLWFVRLPLAILLSARLGLTGVWIAMCAELCFRGVIFLIRLYRERWLRNAAL